MPTRPQSDTVPTISALVKRRIDQGDSARAMAIRAETAGFSIRHQTISQLAAGPPKSWPDATTIRALAFLLDTSERHILLSFGRSLGLSTGRVSVSDLIPPEFDQLPDDVQDAAVRMLRAVAAHVRPAGASTEHGQIVSESGLAGHDPAVALRQASTEDLLGEISRRIELDRTDSGREYPPIDQEEADLPLSAVESPRSDITTGESGRRRRSTS